MANFYKSEVITAMRKQGLVPVFYHKNKDTVFSVIEACVKGGSCIVELLKKTLGFSRIKEPASTTFIGAFSGIPLEVGPPDKVKENGHIALEVTDIEKAIEILHAHGIEFDGEPGVSSDGTVKGIYLKEGSFGTKMRIHLYSPYSEEVETLSMR